MVCTEKTINKCHAEMDGVVRVIPNHILKLHTTRSWDFIGFTQDAVGAKPEGDVVIGLLDTGKLMNHTQTAMVLTKIKSSQ